MGAGGGGGVDKAGHGGREGLRRRGGGGGGGEKVVRKPHGHEAHSDGVCTFILILRVKVTLGYLEKTMPPGKV